MLLTELFKSKADISRDDVAIQKRTSSWVAETMLSDGRDLGISCIHKTTGAWELRFDVDGDYDVTGGGNELEVFSTVISILKFFMDDIKPTHMFMTSGAASRTKLYMRMIKRLVPDWRIIAFSISEYGDEVDDMIVMLKSKEAIKPVDFINDVKSYNIGNIRVVDKPAPGMYVRTLKDFAEDAKFIEGNVDLELKEWEKTHASE